MKLVKLSSDKLYHEIIEVNSSNITANPVDESNYPKSSEGEGVWVGSQSTKIYGNNSSLLGDPDTWGELIIGSKSTLIPLYEVSIYHKSDNTLTDTD